MTLIKNLIVKKYHVKYTERLTSEKMKKLIEEKNKFVKRGGWLIFYCLEYKTDIAIL